jgi:hypothetical protein
VCLLAIVPEFFWSAWKVYEIFATLGVDLRVSAGSLAYALERLRKMERSTSRATIATI